MSVKSSFFLHIKEYDILKFTMVFVNIVIDIAKMRDITYVDNRVLVSYSNCCIDSTRKQFIIAYMINTITTYINHNDVTNGDEIFAEMKCPGFAFNFKTEFIKQTGK